jgi:hypothetical protein
VENWELRQWTAEEPVVATDTCQAPATQLERALWREVLQATQSAWRRFSQLHERLRKPNAHALDRQWHPAPGWARLVVAHTLVNVLAPYRLYLRTRDALASSPPPETPDVVLDDADASAAAGSRVVRAELNMHWDDVFDHEAFARHFAQVDSEGFLRHVSGTVMFRIFLADRAQVWHRADWFDSWSFVRLRTVTHKNMEAMRTYVSGRLDATRLLWTSGSRSAAVVVRGDAVPVWAVLAAHTRTLLCYRHPQRHERMQAVLEAGRAVLSQRTFGVFARQRLEEAMRRGSPLLPLPQAPFSTAGGGGDGDSHAEGPLAAVRKFFSPQRPALPPLPDIPPLPEGPLGDRDVRTYLAKLAEAKDGLEQHTLVFRMLLEVGGVKLELVPIDAADRDTPSTGAWDAPLEPHREAPKYPFQLIRIDDDAAPSPPPLEPTNSGGGAGGGSGGSGRGSPSRSREAGLALWATSSSERRMWLRALRARAANTEERYEQLQALYVAEEMRDGVFAERIRRRADGLRTGLFSEIRQTQPHTTRVVDL